MPLETMEDFYEVKFMNSLQEKNDLQGQIVYLKAKNSKCEELLKVGQDKELSISKQLSDLILNNDKLKKDTENIYKEYKKKTSDLDIKLEKYVNEIGNLNEEMKTLRQKNELLENDIKTTKVMYENMKRDYDYIQQKCKLYEEQPGSNNISIPTPPPPPPPPSVPETIVKTVTVVDEESVKEVNRLREEISRIKEENANEIDKLKQEIELKDNEIQQLKNKNAELNNIVSSAPPSV